MTRSSLLTITSVLSILLLTLHISDDIVRGLDPPGPANLIGIGILVVFLYGTLVYRERLGGMIFSLLTGLGALGMPIIHLRGKYIFEIAASSGGLLFIWTVFALGVLGAFTFLLAIHCIWDRRRARETVNKS